MSYNVCSILHMYTYAHTYNVHCMFNIHTMFIVQCTMYIMHTYSYLDQYLKPNRTSEMLHEYIAESIYHV